MYYIYQYLQVVTLFCKMTSLVYLIVTLFILGLVGLIGNRWDYFSLLVSIEVLSTAVHILLFFLSIYYYDSYFVGTVVYLVAVYAVEAAVALLMFVMFSKQNRKKR